MGLLHDSLASSAKLVAMRAKWLNVAVDITIVIVAALAVAHAVAGRTPQGTLRVSSDDWRALTSEGPMLGPSKATVTIVEFLDYQCPVCARIEDVFVRLEKEHPGRIRRILRHMPITAIHPQAEVAAFAAECADKQAIVAPMHSLLLSQQAGLKGFSFDTLGRSLAVPDESRFADCVLSGEAGERVRTDVELASSLGVTGTPTIIVERLWLTSLSPALLLSVVRSKLK